MPTALDDAAYLTWLVDDNGYRFVRPLAPRRWVGVAAYGFTCAIITGDMHDRYSIRDRWCYHSAAEALAALLAWNGEGEPSGWHRHPGSGRRVSQTGDEFDQEDRPVGAVGVTYIRW